MLDVVDQSADFVEVGMKQSCDSLLIGFWNWKKWRAVCYWWISREWQFAPPSRK